MSATDKYNLTRTSTLLDNLKKKNCTFNLIANAHSLYKIIVCMDKHTDWPPVLAPKPCLVIDTFIWSLFMPEHHSSAVSDGTPAKQGGYISSWNIEDYRSKQEYVTPTLNKESANRNNKTSTESQAIKIISRLITHNPTARLYSFTDNYMLLPPLIHFLKTEKILLNLPFVVQSWLRALHWVSYQWPVYKISWLHNPCDSRTFLA